MGFQVVSEKNVRLARSKTGLPFDRVLRNTNRTWLGRFPISDGHQHVVIDRSTWEVELDDACWTSCRDLK